MTDNEVKRRTVYLLCHKGLDFGRDVYVGSTSQTLAKRLREHKCDSKRRGNEESKSYTRMMEIGLSNWTVRPLLTLECTQDVIRGFERMWCKILRSDLNTNSPIQDDKRERDRMVKFYKRNLAEKKCYCDVCDKAFPCNWGLNQHKDSLKHQYAYLNSLD